MAELKTTTGITEGWTPILIFDGGVDGGIEVGDRRKLQPEATRAAALNAAKAAMVADADAIGFTVEPWQERAGTFARYRVHYMAGGTERRSPWFKSEANADRALVVLRRRYGRAIIYAD